MSSIQVKEPLDSQISKGWRLNKYQGKTNRKVEKKINVLRNRD